MPNAVVEAIKKEFDSTFKEAREVLHAEVKKELDGVRAEMKGVADELAEINAARSEVGAKTSVSIRTQVALGNTVKQLFKVKLAEDAIVLKADAQIDGSTTGTGEELMFTELHAGILTLAEEYGVLLRDAAKFTSRQRTYRLVFGKNATDHGSYDTESAAAESDAESFGSKEVTLLKWRKIIGVSFEALEDSAPEDLGAYIMKKLAEHYGLFMDDQIHTALTGSSNAPTQTLASTTVATYDELIRTTSKPTTSVLSRCAYYTSLATWVEWQLLKDDNSRPLIEGNKQIMLASNGKPVPNQPVGFVGAFPVFVSSEFEAGAATKKIAVFGDLENSVAVIQRKGFGVTSDSSEKFSSDIVLVKGTARNVVSLLHDGATATSGKSAYAIVKCAAA